MKCKLDYDCRECPYNHSCGYEKKKYFNWLPIAIIGWVLFCIFLLFTGVFRN